MNDFRECEKLNAVLETFPRKDLFSLPHEQLMERVDRKYVFHRSRVADILRTLESHYLIIEVVGSVFSPYRSQYLDKGQFEFYHRHHSGFAHRNKVRFRTYPNTQTTFLELKLKNNKGKTVKLRMPSEFGNYNLSPELNGFLAEHIDEYESLKPTAEIRYTRLAFISPDFEARFSIDFEITAHYHDREAEFGQAAILEVKQNRMMRSPIIDKMRVEGIREASMSKYCVGLSLLKPELKSNNFKPSIRKLTKINK